MVLHSAITRESETRSRVALSELALDLLRSLWRTHGPLMFHQSGGCCDGSSPMCYPAEEFVTSDADVLLGVFDIALSNEPTRAVSFWMSAQQFEYWSHTHLTIDVVPGRGSGFSVEAPTGVRFLIRSELMEAREPFA